MSTLGFITVSFFAFLGLVCSATTGIFGIVHSVSTGTPIDIVGVIAMAAIAIPCACWCGWLLHEANN